jgi:hypothetical protein
MLKVKGELLSYRPKYKAIADVCSEISEGDIFCVRGLSYGVRFCGFNLTYENLLTQKTKSLWLFE